MSLMLTPSVSRLVAVDVEVELRRVGGEGAEHAGQLGLLVGLDDQRRASPGRDVRDVAGPAAPELILEAAGAAEPDDRRQVERRRRRRPAGPRAAAHPLDDGVDPELRRRPLLERA